MGFDKKVIGVLALLTAAVYLVGPAVFSRASLSLLLILVVCPLSTVLMMKMMMRDRSNADTGDTASAGELLVRVVRRSARETAG